MALSTWTARGGAGHAAFWHAADTFNAPLGRFLDDLEGGAAVSDGGSSPNRRS
jgi:hypothetical protein